MHLDAIHDLLHARAFALGVAYGGFACLLDAVLGLVSIRRTRWFAGLAFAGVGWLGIRVAWGAELARPSVALALAVLAVGGAAAHLLGSRPTGRAAVRRQVAVQPLLTAAALVPGAVMLANTTPLVESDMSRFTLVLGTVCLGTALSDFDASRRDRGAPWLLLLVAAAGVYVAVPDTELARVLLGVSVPFVILSLPKPVCALGPMGSGAIAGLFCWVVVVGGRGRPGSVVGGLACLGILVAEPIGRRLLGVMTPARRRRGAPGPRPQRPVEEWFLTTMVVVIAQVVLVAYAARVVAREDAAGDALMILIPAAVLAVVVAPWLYTPPDTTTRHLERHHRPSRAPSIR
jgi:hypothetical protein